MAAQNPTLAAVNKILRHIGQPPVNSLDSNPTAAKAKVLLEEVSEEVQARELECNTYDNFELIPDINGEIVLPSGTLDVKSCDSIKVVQIGSRLFDKARNTFKFTTSVKVNIVTSRIFDTLPYLWRNYIAIRAARQFQLSMKESESLYRLTEKDEHDAYVSAKSADLAIGNYNFFESPDTVEIWNR
jgi:hypothetical protein